MRGQFRKCININVLLRGPQGAASNEAARRKFNLSSIAHSRRVNVRHNWRHPHPALTRAAPCHIVNRRFTGPVEDELGRKKLLSPASRLGRHWRDAHRCQPRCGCAISGRVVDRARLPAGAKSSPTGQGDYRNHGGAGDRPIYVGRRQSQRAARDGV